MGTWGYKPFSNDEALDYYGGFHRLDEMKQLIKDGLAGKYKYCCAPYEIAGIILESFGVYDLGHKDRLNIILDCIKTKNLNSSARSELHESLELLLSVSALSIDSRKKVLQECIKCIKKYKDFDPYEYEQEVMNVVNIAKEALNSNLQNATVISEQDLNWLIDANENSQKQDIIEYNRKEYPNGMFLFRIYKNIDSFNEIGFCPGETRVILDKSSNSYIKRGISLDDINITLCYNTDEIDEFMKKYFSKGFKIIKNSEKIGDNNWGYRTRTFYTVYSNDYNKNMYKDTIYCAEKIKDRFYTPLEDTDKLIMSIFKKYENTSSTKTAPQTTGNIALDKFYDKRGRIIGYRITDGKKVMDVYSEQIKQAIASGKIKFDNLTLTKDGRLYMTEKK